MSIISNTLVDCPYYFICTYHNLVLLYILIGKYIKYFNNKKKLPEGSLIYSIYSNIYYKPYRSEKKVFFVPMIGDIYPLSMSKVFPIIQSDALIGTIPVNSLSALAILKT